jgi:uncharacterized protein (TIGR03067 family)
VRHVLLSVLLLATPPVLAAPAPFAKPDRRSEMEKFRGEWEVVSSVTQVLIEEGRGASAVRYLRKRGGYNVVITGDRLQWLADGKVVSESAVRLDRGTIDLTCVPTRETGRGVYKLTGDTLVVCVARGGHDQRPASLEPERDGETRYVLRRKR